jgi:protein-S-isoprenylcysteine O-methyltransferase Ste14
MFGLHGGASYLYLDSSLSHVRTSSPLFAAAALLLVGGLSLVLLAASQLGWKETIGKRPAGLRQAGLYSCTRNPQVVAYAFVVVGYSLLWPSWSGVIWVAIYAVIAHVMVRREEEHLARTFGEEFRQYCEQTPRYAGICRARWAGK